MWSKFLRAVDVPYMSLLSEESFEMPTRTSSPVRAVFKCPEEYKSKFKDSHCLLTISVGQEVHEYSKFYETIQLVNNHFKQCTILVDDSLQRHTLSLLYNASAKELYDQSIAEGTRWIERNQTIYKELNIPYNVIRWDKWLNHMSYNEKRQSLLHAYNTDPDYKKEIERSIDDFIARYLRREAKNPHITLTKLREVCFTYLLEECTALCLWEEDDYNFEVYPSKRNAAMSITHEKFINSRGKYLLCPVAIKFKNRKQLKPQFHNLADKEYEIPA